MKVFAKFLLLHVDGRWVYNGEVPITNPNTQSMGGKAKAAAMTAEQRTQMARDMLKARYAKPKKLKLKKAA